MSNEASLVGRRLGAFMAMSIFSKLKLHRHDVGYFGSARPKMSMAEVNKKLKERESTKEFTSGPIKGFDTNNIPSNSPMEDHHAEAQCLVSSGYMFGIFDGHGGEACSHVVSERLLKYIAATLLPPEILNKYAEGIKNDDLIMSFNRGRGIANKLLPVYNESFKKFLQNLPEIKKSEDFNMEKSLELAFLQLDNDMSDEALQHKHVNSLNKELISVAKSGTVACVAHVEGPHLHLANLGDCSAVLGILNENNSFDYEKLISEHNFDNDSEVERIISEHPPEERQTLFRMDRLLGNLAPLRSLGDFKYKWSRKNIDDVITPFVGYPSVPQHYHTPPYLSGKPEITYHYLRPKDKFMVIASDGLWDIMTPMEVINVVGQHMLGKVYFSPLKLPEEDKTLGEIHEILLERQKGLMTKPIDQNAATHLLRHALGGMEHGIIREERLSFMLSLHPEFSRSIRDDITITVVYFDSDFISNI